MNALRDVISQAQDDKVALAHFNVGTFDMLHAIVRAAESAREPIIIGVSEGERDAFGIHTIVSLIAELRQQVSIPLFLNADHTYSIERVKEAVDAGFDMVIFDGAQLPFQENIENTKACVDYARASGRDVLVEGELGFIGSGSQLMDALPEGVHITEETMTKPDDALRFVRETGVDLFAPAVGNIHGMLKNVPNPALSSHRIKEIHDAVGVPLVLHGGSGVSDADFVEAIEAGMNMIHISTELRRAYREGLEAGLAAQPSEMAPYKYTKEAGKRVEEVAYDRIKLFSRKST